MNQILKDSIYALGTMEQINFLAEVGGMNPSEKRFLQLLHEGQTDDFIREDLLIDKNKYSQFEQRVRPKLALAVFDCINRAMD